MDLLFDAPWWLYVGPVLVGVAMALFGLRRGDKTLRNVGLLLLLVGVGVYLASNAVETDTEKVARQSRELVTTVEKRQWDQLKAFLEPDAAVTLSGSEIYSNRDQIVEACQSRADGSGVSTLNVTHLQPKREGVREISTEIQIYVTANDAGGQPFPTEWRLVWRQSSSGQWQVSDIEALRIANIRASDAKAWFPKAK
jgi:hypothetical protein